MARENNTAKKIAIGAVIAGVAGYVAGILTAPKSGKETRQDIKDKAGDIREDAVNELRDMQDDLANLLESAKTKSVGLGSKAREEFNESVVKAKDAKNKASAVLKAVKSGGSDNRDLDRALRQAKQASKNLGRYLKS